MKIIKYHKIKLTVNMQKQEKVNKFHLIKDLRTCSYSFTLPLILSSLNIIISDNDSDLKAFSYLILLLSLVIFLFYKYNWLYNSI